MPPTVAVLGASRDRSKFGNKCVRAYLEEGWEVYPVNPGASEIEGRRAYPALAEVPAELDRVAVYLPPTTTRELLPEIAAAGADDVFFNPGSATADVLAEARERGIPARDACAIVAIGRSPSQFPSR